MLALLSACQAAEVRTSTRNLDRPGPIAMMCAGRLADTGAPTGLPLARCVTNADGTAPEGATLYGLVANTARGAVALFRTSGTTEPLVDLDPGPGFGFVPVGAIPTDLVDTADGCRAVTANSGSCDLSVIDLPAMLNAACRAQPIGSTTVATCATAPSMSRNVVSRVTPHTVDGPLRARPQEIVVVPASVPAKDDQQECAGGASFRVYATFPSCGLVAEIDMSTGLLVRGLLITPGGFELTDRPHCPVECGAPALDGGTPPDGSITDAAPVADIGPTDSEADAGTAEAGADGATLDAFETADASPADSEADAGAGGVATDVAAEGVLPYAIDLTDEGDLLVVSSAGASFISAVTIDDTGEFTDMRQIPLTGPGGQTTRIAISPPTQALGRFVYGIAADRTVRAVSLDLEQECEANLDLGLISETVSTDQARCFAVADQPPRRVSSTGPGLAFGRRVPRDVTFVQIDQPPDEVPSGGPTATPLYGTFALIALSDGSVAVVDIEDRNFISGTEVSRLRLPHRLRNVLQGSDTGAVDLGLESISGAGQEEGVPVIVSKIGDTELPGQGVYLRAPGEQLANQLLVYEASLVQRVTGQLMLSSDELVLQDVGSKFCKAGVLGRQEDAGHRALQHGDIVQLVGCQDDGDCGVGQVCRRPIARQSISGLCLDKTRQDELFRQCSPWLVNEREYLVRSARTTTLALDALPVEPQEVIKQSPQPAGGCQTNADCADYFLCALADRQVEGQPTLSVAKGECFRPGCDPNGSDPRCPDGQTCVAPLDGSPPICAAVPPPIDPWPPARARTCQDDATCRPSKADGDVCTDDGDCDPAAECLPDAQSGDRRCKDRGWICAKLAGAMNRCMRPSPCFAQLQPYQVFAGRSFMISGFANTWADEQTGECTLDPQSDPLVQGRIPIGLPVYPILLGPLCESSPAPLELPQPNPCIEQIADGYTGFAVHESEAGFTPVTAAGPSTVIRQANPNLWFSIGVSHLAAPPAATGVVDTLAVPRMPRRGLTIELRAQTGYAGMVVAGSTEAVALPDRLLPAPDGNVYITDMGNRFAAGGGRGQVRRVEARTLQLSDFDAR